ncbi:iron-sulfur cluster repair di-iron protein [Empedobacter brevis]|uniref:iron-sulfur cluster repair di-iron protein n=1 Tax=Empedobacter brevis TaxID=247 RepID=UPI002FE0ACCA
MNTKTDLIGEMVAEDFRTAAIFKKHGIDFCCRGGRTIEEACENKLLDAEKIYLELENLPAQTEGNIDFKSWPLDLLAEYVEKKHHFYVEEKTPILLAFLDKLCKVHGERHPELYEISRLFNETAKELSAHLKKEELILFPFIKKMANAKRKGAELETPAFGTVENPVHMMEHEHTVEGDRLAKISELTNNYTPPANACNTYRVAFAMLQDFENDLHTHIHIENNILFPKSIELEKEFK